MTSPRPPIISCPPVTWFDVARDVFRLAGHDPARVTGVSTEEYFRNATTPVAPRPSHSVLDIGKVRATGLSLPDGREALQAYLTR
jgi:dTDP-4-dehydrorhamnose 3,5-epimerase